MKKLIIIGAGGHGQVCYEIAKRSGFKQIYYLDDDLNKEVYGSKIIGNIKDFAKYIKKFVFFIAIGNNALREKIYSILTKSGATIISLIDPSAIVSKTAVIDEGTVIMPGAVINAGSRIGKCVIINTCSSVDHNCDIDDFCHISVGAHIAGNVSISQRCFICAGATLVNNIKIVSDVIVGAGGVVIKDVLNAGTYVGLPAKKR